MTAAPVHLAGERLMLDPMGGLFWPETGLLAVSDLHLEKGSSHARKGSLLPPWDTHATLDRLGFCCGGGSRGSSLLSAIRFTIRRVPDGCPKANWTG